MEILVDGHRRWMHVIERPIMFFFFVSSNNNKRNGEMVLFLSSVEMAKFLLASIWSITCSPNTGVAFVADRLDCIQLTKRLNYILDASEFVIRYRMFKHNRCPKNATSSHCSRVLDHTHTHRPKTEI